MNIEKTTDRLEAFYEVTNTYLSVFGIFGAFGMIIGIAGMGLILLRNYNQRKQEFAILLAIGFRFRQIKQMILSDQIRMLLAGISTGVCICYYCHITLDNEQSRDTLAFFNLNGNSCLNNRNSLYISIGTFYYSGNSRVKPAKRIISACDSFLSHSIKEFLGSEVDRSIRNCRGCQAIIHKRNF